MVFLDQDKKLGGNIYESLHISSKVRKLGQKIIFLVESFSLGGKLKQHFESIQNFVEVLSELRKIRITVVHFFHLFSSISLFSRFNVEMANTNISGRRCH